jgi:TonB family protein
MAFSRSYYFWMVVVFSCVLSFPSCSHAQDAPKRRLVGHSAPAYPSLARSMALQGVVRVEAVVSPDGSVKAVDIKGGHPVLAQAAANAVLKWKWEPASRESREPVEVKFSPE